MYRTLLLTPLLLASGWAQGQALNCAGASVPQAGPLRPTVLAPVAPELIAPGYQLGAPSGVLSRAYDEAQSVDQVLLRLRIEGCQNVAKSMPAPSVLDPNDPAAYKPKTEFDNTPWRFDMSQNGKRMTADEFDAWMKARGVRVAGRKPVASSVVAPVVPGAPPQATPSTAPAPTPTSPVLPSVPAAPPGSPPGQKSQ